MLSGVGGATRFELRVPSGMMFKSLIIGPKCVGMSFGRLSLERQSFKILSRASWIETKCDLIRMGIKRYLDENHYGDVYKDYSKECILTCLTSEGAGGRRRRPLVLPIENVLIPAKKHSLV